MLKLRRGIVAGLDPLTVEVEGRLRAAWADISLVGPVEPGDEVVVNTEAVDLSLGSGGFDIVHVNLTRGLDGEGAGGAHVMKLNYTSLQHPVEPIEVAEQELGSGSPVGALIIPLHGHLAPAVWAIRQLAPEAAVGYVQTAGGGLSGSICRDVARLVALGYLQGHVAVAPCFGAPEEAVTVCGALDAASKRLQWDIAVVGPGPGILGSGTKFGNGGISALSNAHEAAAVGCTVGLSLRMSSTDPRPRHIGLSHHSETVLEHLLTPVDVALPNRHLELEPEIRRLAQPTGHSVKALPVDLDGYAASGLPRRTMGRDLDEDPLFFASPLAAGALAAEWIDGRR